MREKKGNMNILKKESSLSQEEASRTIEQTSNSMTVSDSAVAEKTISKSCVIQSASSTKTISKTVSSSASEFSETQVEEYEFEG